MQNFEFAPNEFTDNNDKYELSPIGKESDIYNYLTVEKESSKQISAVEAKKIELEKQASETHE